MLEEHRFEHVLKSFRVRRGKEWTQEEMARQLGVTRRTYVRWENGEGLPLANDLKRIAALFQLNDTDTDALFRAASQAAPVRQNLPFARNPFFTGRQTLLSRLELLFEHNERIDLTQPVSVSGLGGIGKTQLALEYAHRCSPHLYRYVLWVNASDKASLEASYLSLARLLQLPEQQEREMELIVQAVKCWLEEHASWLLILDNADDLEMACSALPTRPRGHILLTTRSQIVGHLATRLLVEALSPQEGLLFLLRRSGILPPRTQPESLPADLRHEADALVELLGGHPLALDQAGAYLEETGESSIQTRGASFAEYRQLYQQQRRVLLQRRGSLGGEHPETVATTLEICLQKACELHPHCAEVLAFCALLHPDTIPEELLSEKSGLNLDLLQFNEVMGALRRYSLIKRDSEKKVLSLHRLVQVVIKDRMDQEELRKWIECVVQAVNKAFPEVAFEEWSQCERYLPHALVCANWIEEHEAISLKHSAQLLSKAGSLLRERGKYEQSDPIMLGAIALHEQHPSAEHPDTARSLHSLANLYWHQNKYEQAEPLFQQALAIFEQYLGTEHLDTVMCLDDLGVLYRHQGKYEQAELLFQRVLSIREQRLGVSHPDTAKCLNNLAGLYYIQDKFEQTEPLLIRALAIREQQLGTDHPDTAKSLNNLAGLYYMQGKFEQAEPLYQRAYATWERQLGVDHPLTVAGLGNLAQLYQQLGKYEQAESSLQQALATWERLPTAAPTFMADALAGWAELARHQGKYEQAEALYRRALSICELHLGAEHPLMARVLRGLAELSEQ